MTIKEHDDFEKEILRKIDNNERLTEDELEVLVYEYDVDSIEGDRGRWTIQMTTIIHIRGRKFAIEWEEGATEYQESVFETQIPVEVKQITKTVEIKEWVNLEQENGK